ncbi:aconitate hydratase [Nannocystis bainbridge]|uniref:Aconitate hydratase n=1 Tax=Nannocystis bainbridge TaxID=2995303 RepID=A0ABT5DST6_9BACT|nr:aconitate hydratase [Nannocystis bainbridge]MDC0716240.1 aconitate hydratase [Nannocystis bainbridge]
MAPQNVARKLIASHLLEGEMIPGQEIGLRIDQTLTQDATGTLVMLELEAMGLERAATEVSVQYVDHNLLQTDFKNPDDHLFLQAICQRFGIWYSRPGNGVSHAVHMERFGRPGRSLAGSDSHTPAAGSMGMLAFGAGGLDVAFAIAGEPLYLRMPKILGVELVGALPPWVSAKDLVLEMLRRHDVKGCRGMIVEYFGDGLAGLTAMDRHVIANMGTELGATTTVFPSDEQVRRFLRLQRREQDWVELIADAGCDYDLVERIELPALEPLIACPSSPGNVVRVREVEGRPIYQSYIGSSANPGLRDFWIAAEIVKGLRAHERVSLDINPTSRALIENLARLGSFQQLIAAGARFHQAGCNGCIGMGQAPATHQISLRTVPRNFPGRSGTKEDLVYLVSPETAAASALAGAITDPRDLEKLYGLSCPRFAEPEDQAINHDLIAPAPSAGIAERFERGPNIKALPLFAPLVDDAEVPVLLKMDDDISTDEILMAGARALPFRSNIPAISQYAFFAIDETFAARAHVAKEQHGGHVVIAGDNYGQGSSREHAALAPRYLGQIAVIARSYARIAWQNLANFGILALTFVDPADYDWIEQGDQFAFSDLRERVAAGGVIVVRNLTQRRDVRCAHQLSERQVRAVLAGGLINQFRQQRGVGNDGPLRCAR